MSRMTGGFGPTRARLLGMLLAALLVALAAILPYISTLDSYFLGDDFGIVQLYGNKPALHFLSLFTRSWHEDIWGYVTDELRPFTALFYQFNALSGAGSPTAYRVTNIALHVLNSLLVLLIARFVIPLTLPAAVFAGVFFAILPVHAETVSWITGRVDSILTLFYLSSFFAYARWRQTRSASWYWGAVLLFFMALFSKQSAVTMLASLLLYDLLVHRRPIRFAPRSLAPYLPFAILTAVYLFIRSMAFHNLVREQLIGKETLRTFFALQAQYSQLLLFGSEVFPRALTPLLVWTIILFLAAAFALLRSAAATAEGRGRFLWYFGPIWWLISTAPLTVAGYQTARFLCLAAAGYAVAVGLAFDAGWRRGGKFLRPALVLAAVSLLVASERALRPSVAVWNRSAFVSEKILRDLEGFSSTAPPGSLLVAGAPSTSAVGTWLWSWAAPFAFQPPFTKSDLGRRVGIIVPNAVHCCLPPQWFEETGKTIRTWSARPDHPPVLALTWDPSTGALSDRREAEDPDLRGDVVRLAQAATPQKMLEGLTGVLGKLKSDDSIPAAVDSPPEGALLRGPLTVAGWAKSVCGDVDIRVILDDGRRSATPKRFPRPDVAQVFPHLGDVSRAGYSATFDPEDNGPAEHSVTVVIRAPEGSVRRLGPIRFRWTRNEQ